MEGEIVDIKSTLSQAQACNFIKKETPAQMFSCEFNEISKNMTEHLWVTASVLTYTFSVVNLNFDYQYFYYIYEDERSKSNEVFQLVN